MSDHRAVKQRRFTSAHALALVALMVALAGSAYAAGEVNRAKLSDNTLRLGGYPAADYRQAFSHKALSKPRTLTSSGGFATLLSFKLRNDSRQTSPALYLAHVTVRSSSTKDSQLQLRTLMDGKPIPGGPTVNTIVHGTQQTVQIVVCNGMPRGAHTITLQVQIIGPDLVLGDAAEDGFRPIVIPPHTAPRT